MTVPTLILIGELDDWTLAKDCRNMVGRPRRLGNIAHRSNQGVPIKLVVYPGAYHGFDASNLKTPDQAARASPRIQPIGNGSIDRAQLREFLGATIGNKRARQLSIKAVVFDAYGTLYDVQSVAAVTEETFPGYGEIITQIWRIKQLEYTWLRSLMRRYEDFSVVTRESLAYTLRILGLQYDDADVRAHHGQISASRSLSRCACRT